MNLEKNLHHHSGNPSTALIHQTDNVKVISIGLKKGVELKEHHTPVPAFLTVVKGSIDFYIDDEVHRLNYLDTFTIPVGDLHHVIGVGEENVFMLILELE